MMDLDAFKVINDTFGHQHGDSLLREVGTRLSECVGSRGFVASGWRRIRDRPAGDRPNGLRIWDMKCSRRSRPRCAPRAPRSSLLALAHDLDLALSGGA
jgi:hypothetical protein